MRLWPTQQPCLLRTLRANLKRCCSLLGHKCDQRPSHSALCPTHMPSSPVYWTPSTQTGSALQHA